MVACETILEHFETSDRHFVIAKIKMELDKSKSELQAMPKKGQ